MPGQQNAVMKGAFCEIPSKVSCSLQVFKEYIEAATEGGGSYATLLILLSHFPSHAPSVWLLSVLPLRESLSTANPSPHGRPLTSKPSGLAQKRSLSPPLNKKCEVYYQLLHNGQRCPGLFSTLSFWELHKKIILMSFPCCFFLSLLHLLLYRADCFSYTSF